MLLERVFGPDAAAAAAAAVVINIVAVLLLDSTPKIAKWVSVPTDHHRLEYRKSSVLRSWKCTPHNESETNGQWTALTAAAPAAPTPSIGNTLSFRTVWIGLVWIVCSYGHKTQSKRTYSNEPVTH